MEEELGGIYPAFVCNIKDEEKRGRIKVVCADVFGDTTTESAWCEPCVPVAYDGGGDICVPKLGEGVWVAFVNGDIDSPVYLGGWWQEKQTLLDQNKYDEEAQSLRYINFEDNIIRMEKGTMKIYLKDSPETIVIQNGSVTFNCNVTVNGTLTVSGDAVIGGKSFLGHTHTDSVGGSTTPPS